MTNRRQNFIQSTVLHAFFMLVIAPFLLAQTKKADLIISGGNRLDGWQRRIYDDGAIVVTRDTIVAVGPRAQVESQYSSAQSIDAKGKLILPGFVNGHTHVPITYFADCTTTSR